jgi:hypothetical protein
MATYTPERVETFDHGVTSEYYEGEQIVVFRLPDYEDATVNAWGERLIENLKQRDPLKPLYLVLVLEEKLEMKPTRMRDWAGVIIETCKGIPKTHIALVIDQPLIAQIASAFTSALFLRSSHKIDMKVMAKFPDAIEWQLKNMAMNSRSAQRSS